LTLLDIAVFFEHLRNLSFRELGVDACDEKVGTRVDGTIIVISRSGNVLHVAVTMAAG
jgi:hypothetical protein